MNQLESMIDLSPIHYDLDETTCQGFLSPSPLVVLTPLHLPPPPAPIPTAYIDMGYIEVWKSIAQKETTVPNMSVQVPSAGTDTRTASALSVPTNPHSQDKLSVHYGRGSTLLGLRSFPMQPGRAAPTSIKKNMTPSGLGHNDTEVDKEHYSPGASVEMMNKLFTTPDYLRMNSLEDSSNTHRAVSNRDTSVLGNYGTSTGTVPGVLHYHSLKQTTLVSERTSSNLRFKVPYSKTVSGNEEHSSNDPPSIKKDIPTNERNTVPLTRHVLSRAKGDSEQEMSIKSTSNPTRKLKRIRGFNAKDLIQLASHFSAVQEVAACLVYKDGSTQLRPTTGKRGVGKAVSEVDGLCIAFPVMGEQGSSPVLQYFLLPMSDVDDSLYVWCRDQLLSVLSRARMITYGGQQIAFSLISWFKLHETREWLQWTILDVHVGEWLLNPDHPTDTFLLLLARFHMQPPPACSKITEAETLLCRDVSLLGPVVMKLYQNLQKENLWALFERIEVKLIPILAGMKARGIKVDSNKLLECGELLKTKIAKVEELAHKAVGHKFSINSTAQLRQILFDDLGLDEMCSKKLSKTHVYKHKSTSEVVLTQLQEFHALPGLVLRYRQLCKVNATYINGVIPYISEGILHASWVQTGAATGRLASCNPNIQAFPKQSINLGTVREQFVVGKEPEEVTINLRDAVESRLDHSFLAADFKSIELRIVAHYSEDKLLISTLREAPDIFVHLASRWMGEDLDKVTSVHRERTKRVVYAVIYGVGKEKLGEILHVEPGYAKELTDSFLAKFPGIQIFITKTVNKCRNKGFLETLCGRKRWFPHINSTTVQLRLQSERQAVNFLVQGSAADICKSGMVDVSTLLSMEHPRARLLLQIHDEILFEVPDTELKEVTRKVILTLESPSILLFPLKVPLEVKVTSGKTWSSIS